MGQENQKSYLEPDFAEFISRRLRDISAQINCHTIGTIVSFNSTNQTVKVSINLQKIIRNITPLPGVVETGDSVISYPLLVNVPILFLQGGSSYLTFPIAAGDTCLLLFCDRDMDIWLNEATIAPPNSDRVHDINDAIAIVGLRNFRNSLANYNTEIISLSDKTGERLTQAGFLQPYAGGTAPSGWLLCFGQAISRATYSVLFAIIGTTYGAGDGSTTFNVPDMRGRTVAGLDNMGGTNANVLTNTYNPNRNTLGGATGEEAHALTIGELATHNHIVGFNTTGSSGLGTFEEGAGAPNMSLPAGNGATYQGTSADTGSSTPHQNVQPTRMINWIIKI